MTKKRKKTQRVPNLTLEEKNQDWQWKITQMMNWLPFWRRPVKTQKVKSCLQLIKVKKEDLGPNALIITLWEEGFTLSTNPDELRPYKEPKNAKFMAELKKGVVPSELRNNANAKGMSVSLEDKRGESFYKNQKAKPPSYFGGQGVSLGGKPPVEMKIQDSSKITKICKS